MTLLIKLYFLSVLERVLPSAGSHHKWPQWPKLSQFKAGGQKLLLDLPSGCGGQRVYAIHCCFLKAFLTCV